MLHTCMRKACAHACTPAHDHTLGMTNDMVAAVARIMRRSAKGTLPRITTGTACGARLPHSLPHSPPRCQNHYPLHCPPRSPRSNQHCLSMLGQPSAQVLVRLPLLALPLVLVLVLARGLALLSRRALVLVLVRLPLSALPLVLALVLARGLALLSRRALVLVLLPLLALPLVLALVLARGLALLSLVLVPALLPL